MLSLILQEHGGRNKLFGQIHALIKHCNEIWYIQDLPRIKHFGNEVDWALREPFELRIERIFHSRAKCAYRGAARRRRHSNGTDKEGVEVGKCTQNERGGWKRRCT
jgi:hypothetical protein